MEFGEAGNATGDPAEKVDVVDDFVIGTMVALQIALVGFAVVHAVVLAYTVGLAGAEVPRTVKLIGDAG
jgi:hypothetical protein